MGIDIRAIPPPLQFDAHGVCRVANTRVTLLSLIDAFQEGDTPEEIYQEYPAVSLGDVYAVIAFYLVRRWLKSAGGFWLESRSRCDRVPGRRKSQAQDLKRPIEPEPVGGRGSST